MRVIVTGGAGFVGSHVVDAYIKAGHEVLVLDDLSTGCKENLNSQADFVRLDIRDEKAVASVFDRFRPQLVNHHAAQIDIRRSVADPLFDAEVNVLGTINLLQHSVRSKVEGFLFASSGGAMYGETPQPVTEDAIKAPLSPYGAAKVAVEDYLFSHFPPVDATFQHFSAPRNQPRHRRLPVVVHRVRCYSFPVVLLFNLPPSRLSFANSIASSTHFVVSPRNLR